MKRLTLEAGHALRIVRKMCRQDFQGYYTIQPGIMRAIHFTHSTGADLRYDLVRSQEITRQQFAFCYCFRYHLRRWSFNKVSGTFIGFQQFVDFLL